MAEYGMKMLRLGIMEIWPKKQGGQVASLRMSKGVLWIAGLATSLGK